jgi:hypothetical protein
LVHDLYIEKVCKRYDLVNEHTRFPKIPLPYIGLKRYEGKTPRAQVKAYQERVGSLVSEHNDGPTRRGVLRHITLAGNPGTECI